MLEAEPSMRLSETDMYLDLFKRLRIVQVQK